MKNVLIVNQSAELYGADRIILELILNFPNDYTPIVVLHEDGPLKKILEEKGIQIIHCSVIKVKRGILGLNFFLKLPFEIIKSFSTIKKELKGKKIDLVHSNATSVFIGAFYSFFFRKKHLWHVHEIIEQPKFLANAYPQIVNFFSDKIVYNSKATYLNFFNRKRSIQKKSVIVYNGQERNIPIIESERNSIRQEKLKIFDDTIVIGLVGRISKLKGQIFLLNAFYDLQKKYDNIHLVFVGSPPPSKEFLLTDLIEKIDFFQLQSKVTIIDFQENIWPIYDALDILTVPSIEPESFGLVATEGMLSYKPIIASNHGGLAEIVVDNVTGALFVPNNKEDLKQKLIQLIESPSLIKEYGLNGNQRVKEVFSTKKYVSGIKTIYDTLSNS
ncbi:MULTISPECIES: glycosyltransferase family 4 protein [Flavobacterium]|uniref:glycosyltransferase family 4 protein n=2 Tax=Flavobacteriaceae TaxID=49546 RepID=UPI00280801F3|nr:glycosyltransferase family 4 protein [Flavobacterium lindanitolerans]MDQ7959313.1 glycosyltransferase family 4 protein [Flavobacterium lindanitolerans]